MRKLLFLILLSLPLLAQKAVLFTGQPGAVPVSLTAGSGTVTTLTIAGTSNQIAVSGTCTITTTGTCTLSLPSGLVLPGTINGLTLTTTTGTFTLTNAKTFVVNNTLTIQATDGTTLVVADPASVTSGHCVSFTKSGSTLTLTDAGACGTGTGNAAAAVTTTCSGATATFTATSNTVNKFQCTLVATNVTSSTLASLTTGQAFSITVTQPGGGGITFATPTGITGWGGIGTGANETCTQAFIADSSTTAHQAGPMTCTGGSPSITIPNSSTGTTTINGPATGTNMLTAPSGTNTAFGSAAANTGTGRQDFSGASSTATLKVATSDPGTCTVGDVLFRSDLTAGQNIKGCTATNTWTAQGGGGGSTSAHLTPVQLVGALGNGTAVGLVANQVGISPALVGGGGTDQFPGYIAFDASGNAEFNVDIPSLPSTFVSGITVSLHVGSATSITGSPNIDARAGCRASGSGSGVGFNTATAIPLGAGGTVVGDTNYVHTSGTISTGTCAADQFMVINIKRTDTNSGALQMYGFSYTLTY